MPWCLTYLGSHSLDTLLLGLQGCFLLSNLRSGLKDRQLAVQTQKCDSALLKPSSHQGIQKARQCWRPSIMSLSAGQVQSHNLSCTCTQFCPAPESQMMASLQVCIHQTDPRNCRRSVLGTAEREGKHGRPFFLPAHTSSSRSSSC